MDGLPKSHAGDLEASMSGECVTVLMFILCCCGTTFKRIERDFNTEGHAFTVVHGQ